MIGNRHFLKNLIEFDKDHIKSKSMRNLKKILEHPKTNPDVVRSSSNACYGLVLWLLAMISYNDIITQMEANEPEPVVEEVKEEVEVEEVVQEVAVEQSPEQLRENQMENLVRAVEALKSIDKASINEIKSFNNPPEVVLQVLSGVALLLGHDTTWPAIRKMLGNPHFMDHILNFDKNNINPKTIKKLNKVLESPKTRPEVVRGTSQACYGLIMWLRGIREYYNIHKDMAAQKVEKVLEPVEEVKEEVKVEEAPQVSEDKTPEQMLEEQLPALEMALESINCIDKNSINEVKSFNNPNESVLKVFEGIATLLGRKDTSWTGIRKMLGDPHFTEHLKSFDKDHIKPQAMKKVNKLLANPKLQPEEVRKVSQATHSLVMWLFAMSKYHEVMKQIKPSEPSPVKQKPKPVEKVNAAVISTEAIVEDYPMNQDEVTNQLDCVTKASISEVKSFASPPQVVWEVCKGVLMA